MRRTFVINDEQGNATVMEYNPDCGICYGQKMARVSTEIRNTGQFGEPKLEWCKCVKKVDIDKMTQKLLYKCKSCSNEEVREGSPADACCRMCGGKLEIIGEAKERKVENGQMQTQDDPREDISEDSKDETPRDGGRQAAGMGKEPKGQRRCSCSISRPDEDPRIPRPDNS